MGGWSNTTALSVARTGCAAAGVQTAALAISGATTAPAYLNQTELFNGATWSYGGNVNVARMDHGGCGAYNAALAFGGHIGSYTGSAETYNGTVWSMGVTMLAQRSRFAGFGTATAAVAAGGYNGGVLGNTDLFNGTAWTASGNLIVSRSYVKGCGTTTAGLVAGGYVAAVSNITEVFNGSTWSYGGNLVTARQSANLWGTTTNSISAGGSNASSICCTNCEKYNGSAWSAIAYCTHSVYRSGQAGTVTSAIRIGGDDAITRAYVEVYNEPLTSYSWATGPCLTTGRYYSGGAGESISEAILFGGTNYLDNVYYQTTESFNGTVWGTGGGLSRAKGHVTGSGSKTTAICVGGSNGSYLTDLDTYNGTVWTAGGELNTARDYAAAAGNSSSGLVAGGRGSSPDICTDSELYDGTTWSSVGTLNTPRKNLAGCGVQTDAMCSGGYKTSAISNITEKFNGSTWSNSGTLNTVRQHPTIAGVASDAKIAGGVDAGGPLSTTERWTGATWTIDLSMNYASMFANNGNMGTANNFIVAGGNQPGSTTYAGMQIYTGGIPVLIDGAIFTSTGSQFIQQGWPPAMEGVASLYAFDKYIGPFFDLDYEVAQFEATAAFLANQGIMAPFDFANYPMDATTSMLADLHVDAIMIATLPAMTGSGTLAVRSGIVIQNLPVFTILATGQIGEIGRVSAYLPGLRLAATGLTGGIGGLALPLPFLTITSSGGLAPSAVANLTLPFFYINAHGETKAAQVVFKVLAMNLKNFAITQYDNFDFNSFAEFNGLYLGAKEDGIYPLSGSKDQNTDIDVSLTTGKAFIEHYRLRDLFSYGLTGGQKRSKIARGLHSGYVDFTIQNENGEDLDLDYFEVFGDPVRRKKH